MRFHPRGIVQNPRIRFRPWLFLHRFALALVFIHIIIFDFRTFSECWFTFFHVNATTAFWRPGPGPGPVAAATCIFFGFFSIGSPPSCLAQRPTRSPRLVSRGEK